MTTPRSTFGELALVLLTGVGLGLGANEMNPDGLDIGRDYFPKGVVTPPGETSADVAQTSLDAIADPTGADADADSGGAGGGDGAAAATPDSTDDAQESPPGPGSAGGAELAPAVVARLAAKGLTPVTHDEAVQLWQDPMYAYEAYIFIDARDDSHYTAGHIPSAYQFDHFRAERFQDQMLQLLPTAMEVVVYCNGGDCEDSESAALFLIGLGADPAHLRIYTGGIAEWQAAGLPVETGERLSGVIVGGEPDDA